MKKFILTLIFLISALFVPLQTLAAPYGDCAYGEGLYNEGCSASPTPTPQPSSGSSGSSDGGTSAPEASTCTNQPPSGTPDLFQIDGNTSTGVTVFFSPVLGNTDRYFVSYSTNSSAEEFGFEFNSTWDGVISVNVSALSPNTVYYFKVRAGNGCMPGEWSNVMVARSGQRLPTYRWSSLPRIVSTGVVRRVSPASVQQVEIDASKPTSVPAQPTSQPSKEQTTQPQAQQESPSFLQKVTNFIKGLFGK